MSSTAESGIVLVLTTLGAETDAASFARALVEEHLAACVSALPAMTSVYRWNGVVETAREHQVVIKTTEERLDALSSRLRALHPYELPEFVVVRPQGVSPAYGEWVRQCVGGGST